MGLQLVLLLQLLMEYMVILVAKILHLYITSPNVNKLDGAGGGGTGEGGRMYPPPHMTHT